MAPSNLMQTQCFYTLFLRLHCNMLVEHSKYDKVGHQGLDGYTLA